MTLHVEIAPEAESRLRERAAEAGEDIASYASRVLTDAIVAPRVDELLAPFRRQVAESGMTDAERDAFYEDLRNKVWSDRQRSASRSSEPA